MSSDFVDNLTPVDSEEELAPGSSVPVGITIAYKRQEQGFNEEKIRHTPKMSSTKKKQHGSSSKKKKKLEESLKKSKSFQVFLESAAIYTLCLILPTIIAFLYNWYDVWKYERDTGEILPQEESLWYAYLASSPNYQWLSNAVYKPVADYVCVDAGSESSYSWSLFSSMVARTGFCPISDVEAEFAGRRRSVLSDDVTAWNDVFTIAVCSFLLAFVRIAIIRVTVPIEDSDTLEAMVRCKSVHLLGSDYIVTPAGTPLTTMRTIARLPQAVVAPFLLPNLNDSGDQEELDNSEMFGYNIDATTERDDDPPVRMHTFVVGAPATTGPMSRFSQRLQGVGEEQAVAGDPGISQPPLPNLNLL
jgi:hypothetical protein